jgi:hypothetical protein
LLRVPRLADVGIPDLTVGNDGAELAQDRASEDGLGLGGLELVRLARGQVPVREA